MLDGVKSPWEYAIVCANCATLQLVARDSKPAFAIARGNRPEWRLELGTTDAGSQDTMQQTIHLPVLSTPYELDTAAIAAFQQDGHVCLRGVCTDEEVAAYRPVIGNAVQRLNPETRALEERDTYGKAFLQTMNLWVDDEQVKRYVFAKRFAGIAARLMGVEGVRLYHDQALFKEPHGGPTPWHQDQHYWPLATNHTVTLWMPLVDVNEDMGVMTFASGSHMDGYLGDHPIFIDTENPFEHHVAEMGFKRVCHGAMRAGDATFHNGWTFHNASPNITDRMREVMTIIYFADGTRVGEPDNENRKADLEQWLPGLAPGDLAASPINPVLYP